MMIRTFFPEIAKGLMHLAFPQLCEGCRIPLLLQEHVLCMSCIQQLPQTDFHDRPLNEAATRLAGRVPFEHATAFGYFEPDGLLQHLLHRLKYKRRKEVGLFLGRQAGYSLRHVSWSGALDAIVPVPLHPRKQDARGFNQASLVAQGLGEILSLPVLDKVLIRSRYTESQTKKSREERVINVRDAFRLAKGPGPAAQHVLLIDDVLTTGATLEAAAAPLLQVPGMKISLFTVGLAMF